MTDQLISYDAIALGELVRKGEIKSTELLEISIQRIEKVNPIHVLRVGPKLRD